MKEKVNELWLKVKTFWRRPPKGYDVCLKEFVSFNIGASSAGLIGPLLTYTAIATTTPFFSSYFGISNGVIVLFSWLGILFTLLRAPITSMIIDNSHSKRGKFLPLLTWSLVGLCVCFGVIPFIPYSWTQNVIFSINLPTIKWLAVAASQVKVNVALLVVFFLVQIGTFFYQIFVQAIGGVEQTITTNSQERTNIASFKGLIANIPGEIIKTLLPFVAALCVTKSMKEQGINGMENILLYKIFFPIFAALAIFVIFFMVRGVKERVVLERSHVTKVRFRDGAKELSKNKYFWLMQLFTIAVSIRAVSSGNFLYWVVNFGMENITGTAKDILYAVAFTIIPMAFTPAMALAPFITHKIGKKNLMLYSCVCYVVVFAIQTAFASNAWVVLFCLFLQNFCAGLQLVQPVMISDSLDYQQYKTGKRLEGFWQNYALLITTIAGFFIVLLTPIFQSFGGLKLGEVPNDVLKVNKEIRNSVYMYTSLLSLIGAVLSFIPILLYDLTEKKHASIVRVLKVRAIVKNYEDNAINDKDIVSLKEILDFAKEGPDKILDDELVKYDFLEEITKDVEQAKINIRIEEEKQAYEEFLRNVEFEEAKLVNYLARMKTKCSIEQSLEAKLAKKGKHLKKTPTVYDEEVMTADFIQKSKHIKHKEEGMDYIKACFAEQDERDRVDAEKKKQRQEAKKAKLDAENAEKQAKKDAAKEKKNAKKNK